MARRGRRDPEGRCPRCALRREACLCSELPQVVTRTEILIVRHLSEAARSSNTGRIAHLALPRSRLLDYGGGRPFDDALLRAPRTWLLYPEPGGAAPQGPPERLVVLDATWRQARKMVRRLEALWGMPRLCLAAPSMAPPRLRIPTRPDGLSTLEAIAAAVERLEGAEKAQPLAELHARFVRRALAMRGLEPSVA
jgi:DTW domain-containing protein YfiP